ncbi:MAG: LuxR C-terminal-related transcriptional regulator [Dehalococcoidia bacterium]
MTSHPADSTPAIAGLPAGVLLEAKLHPPMPPRNPLPRPHLLERLDTATARPVTLVSAPAGFGKSTLLAAWCATLPPARRVAWVALDDDDNDPVVFWTYLLNALHRLEPVRVDPGLDLLNKPGVSLTRAVLPALLNELWSLDQPVVLVLDDYHLVREPACHESLRFFLRRLPPCLHLVIASRADPDLELGTLRARGQLAELRATTLSFTDDEAATFLTDRLGLPLTATEVQQLTERTEGWPAGLYLAGLSLRDRTDTANFIAGFAGTHRHIVDYLGGEVLEQLPEEMRTFLLQTSILDRFSAALCDAVTGQPGARARLAELRRTNLFVLSLDESGEWYRYHHLFRGLLQLELERANQEGIPALHRRAAVWYQSAGDGPAAMRHALAASDDTLAGDLLLEYTQPFSAAGRLATLVTWVEQLPAATIAARPALAIAAAWIAALSGQARVEVERLLEAAEAGPDAGPYMLGEPSSATAVALVRAAFPFDNAGRALYAAQTLTDGTLVPGSPSYLLARSALGQALYLAGRPAEARGPLEEVLRTPRAERQQVNFIATMAHLAQISLDLGEVAQADHLAHCAVQHCDEAGLTSHPSTSFAYIALSAVLAQRGAFAEAEAVLARGVEPHLPAFQQRPLSFARALLALAPVRYARGHTEAAATLLAEAGAVLRTCADPGMLPQLLADTERRMQRVVRRTTGLRADLSEGELRVLHLLASDLNQREISRELYLSVNTVKTHARNIYTKLDAGSRAEAVTRARTLGLIA